jgi:uncharacterized membrane protein YhaH (DUF805 family)
MLLPYGVTGDDMSTLQYLFGFKGRINRAKIWLFVLICIVWEIVAVAVVCLGLNWANTLKSLKAAAIPAAETSPAAFDFTKVVWPSFDTVGAMTALAVVAVLIIALFWASFAIYVKRLHDRNKSAWWLIPYCFLPGVFQLYGESTKVPALTGTMTTIGAVLYGIGILIGLWVFIELYCFRGTKGPNRFGNDPLDGGPVYCDPEKPVEGCIPKP